MEYESSELNSETNVLILTFGGKIWKEWLSWNPQYKMVSHKRRGWM